MLIPMDLVEGLVAYMRALAASMIAPRSYGSIELLTRLAGTPKWEGYPFSDQPLACKWFCPFVGNWPQSMQSMPLLGRVINVLH